MAGDWENDVYFGEYKAIQNRHRNCNFDSESDIAALISDLENFVKNKYIRSRSLYYARKDIEKFKKHLIPKPQFSLETLHDRIRGEVRSHTMETGKRPSALILGHACYQMLRSDPRLRFMCLNPKTKLLDKYDGMKVFAAVNVEDDHVEVF